MKRIITLSIAALLLGAGLSGPALAQYYGGGVNQAEAQMQARISAGVSNGRLSQREASNLQRRLAELQRLEARLRGPNGRLSFGERARLDGRIASLNAQITRDLNNFEHRQVGYWNHHRRWF